MFLYSLPIVVGILLFLWLRAVQEFVVDTDAVRFAETRKGYLEFAAWVFGLVLAFYGVARGFAGETIFAQTATKIGFGMLVVAGLLCLVLFLSMTAVYDGLLHGKLYPWYRYKLHVALGYITFLLVFLSVVFLLFALGRN